MSDDCAPSRLFADDPLSRCFFCKAQQFDAEDEHLKCRNCGATAHVTLEDSTLFVRWEPMAQA